MQKKLVSVITVCYNGEKFLKRCINSILSQTYDLIEIVFVNDGSTDNTEKIFNSLIPKIKKRGYKYTYMCQENSGQSVALNNALKVFNGEFVTFLDVDDEFEKTSVEKKVKFLEKNPTYGFVRTKGKMVDEETNEVVGHIQHQSNEIKSDIFEDLVLERDIWVSNGCYMIKTDALIKAIPDRNIYTNKGGQNWQIFIPVAKNNKCGYIDEELFIYHVIKNSHSHSEGTFELEWSRILNYESILKEVLKRLNSYEKYEKILIDKYSKIRLRIARKYKKKKEIFQEFKILMKNKTISIKDFGVFVLGILGV